MILEQSNLGNTEGTIGVVLAESFITQHRFKVEEQLGKPSMSSNAQHEDERPMLVSSMTQNVDKADDTNKLEGSKECAVQDDASLMERDYIGLSAKSSASTPATHPSDHKSLHSNSCKSADAGDEEPECGDTELRLGIGPYNGDVGSSHSPQVDRHLVQGLQHQLLFPQIQMLKQSEDGPSAHYRCHLGGVGSVEFRQSFWPLGPGIAPGRFMIPVPKVSMVPAKRPFLEVIGENNSKPSTCAIATKSNTPSESVALERASHNSSSCTSPLPMVASSSNGVGLYAWNPSISVPNNVVGAAWQHGNCEQEGMVATSPTKTSCPSRAFPPPPLFKPSTALPAIQYDRLPPMRVNSSVSPHASSTEKGAVRNLEVSKEDANGNKATMVGWPPVRSFRRNTLQSAGGLGASKGTGALSGDQKHEAVNKVNESVADQQIKGINKDALFVKAKLDGVRICRKVDLASYNSYDSLKSALQEMFQGFVCNDNPKLDLLHGKHYVLTHEDRDGDWMLVGDVPWRMFITTVKSLRIMKAVDAVGLGEKVLAKLKAQDME